VVKRIRAYLFKNVGLWLNFYRYSLGRTKIYFTGERKHWTRVFWDLVMIYFREGEFCSHYYALGYGLKGRHTTGYIGRKRILAMKEAAEQIMITSIRSGISYAAITKDKYYAGSILRANGLPTLVDLGIIIRGKLYNSEFNEIDLSDISVFGSELVLKNTVLEASEGVLFLKSCQSSLLLNDIPIVSSDLHRIIRNGVWVVQERYRAHHMIAKISPGALNVIRIVTLFDGLMHKAIGGFQGFATGNAKTDSWSKGSIYVGINFEKSCLKKYGYRSPWHSEPGLVLLHPDTDVCFDKYPIPFLNEAVSVCLKAHKIFYTNFMLGWDVAITEKGPLIVEVNENPGMNVFQMVNSGMKEDINNCYRSLILLNQDNVNE